MSNRARVHVVVVNHRSVEEFRGCLASLLPTRVATITVLDNASGGDEVDQLRDLARADDRVRVIAHPENVGFGAGVNAAIEHVPAEPGDHLWILNPDTIVNQDAPTLLSEALLDGADLVSPLILTGNSPEVVWFAGGAADLRHGVTRHHREGEAPPAESGEPFATNFITGAALMITARAWAALDGFREDLFLYWEDADLCRRAVAAGFRLRVVPRARVWHAQGASSADDHGGNGPAFYYYNQRNRVVVCGPEVGGPWRLVAVTGVRETLRLLAKPVLLETRPRGAKFVASVRGLRDGLAGRTGPASS